MRQSVLFVCLGNICRSPLAEAALREECKNSALNVIIDSAGTGDWHVDQPPDQRAQAVAAKNGVEIAHLRARQVNSSDFRDFDHIIALDNQNMADLKILRPSSSSAQLSLLFDHVDGKAGQDVSDPYYGGPEGFDQTWEEVTAAAKNLRILLTSSK
ncbi:low molecular weight protein-tyrosine-phosphatase [Parasphingorhabdus sp.]|jgi:protein-tyrosine phosphatase|uniref:low molecular weight protein-tyrosine-phosphatase n=1 Tax=Parasphingorhabdus sp. TaxID=2709688 RepID=UPI0007F4353F|nr:phosphotyrosine protein phosphatase [Sphingomonadales bacterium EhC05]